MPKDAKRPDKPKGGKTPFRRFEELAKRLVTAPKTRIHNDGEGDREPELSS